VLTIFTLPKAFSGHTGVIQRNALRNWRALGPGFEILMCGEEEGLAACAAEIGGVHLPNIEKNEFGTPMLSSAFLVAQQRAHHSLLMYVNSDIMFMPDLLTAIPALPTDRFLASGRRWDLDVDTPRDFTAPDWPIRLGEEIRRSGVLHSPSGMDYFLFPRGSITLPEFAVGRPGWDSWLVYDKRSRRVPVIDCTSSITVVHQNHDYSHSKFGGAAAVLGPEYTRNVRVAGGYSRMMTLRDADRVLTKGAVGRPPGLKGLYTSALLWYPLRFAYWLRRRFQLLMASGRGA
jgi:hypothetical protein